MPKIAKNTQPQEQRKSKDVFLFGIKKNLNLNVQDLRNIFLKFCRCVGVADLNLSHIEDFVQREDGIIVKFKRSDPKAAFVSKTRGKSVDSNLLFRTTGKWKVRSIDFAKYGKK